MPRPNPPPTPGSSSDLRGKECGGAALPSFALPPAAFTDSKDRASTSSSTPEANASDSSYRPVSPASSPELARKQRPAAARLAGAVVTREDFALPPPPTRSRKIIQMKPKHDDGGVEAALPVPTPSAAAAAAAAVGKPAAPPSKRKQTAAAAGSTAAGRKIARKTAHSLIERRRRSKMNEEFGVLKEMIPACRGQEMHKLAILQASIEYLRYLEQCVADLQAATHHSPRPARPPPALAQQQQQQQDSASDSDEAMSDIEAAASSTTTASTPATHPLSQSRHPLSHISTAPAGRHYSQCSAPSYSPPHPPSVQQPSPAFSAHGAAFGLGSPALLPAAAASSALDCDREATAALLMLNSDRRSLWRAADDGGRGLSVRDLLSG